MISVQRSMPFISNTSISLYCIKELMKSITVNYMSIVNLKTQFSVELKITAVTDAHL